MHEMALVEKEDLEFGLGPAASSLCTLETTVDLRFPICKMAWETLRSTWGPSGSEGLGFCS